MKTSTSVITMLPLAFVLGGMLGYLSPSADLRELRQRATVEAAKRPSVATGFGSFAQMVNIPESASGRRRHRPEKANPAEPSAPGPAVTNAAPEMATDGNADADAPVEPQEETPRKADPEDLRLRLEEASDLWRTRAELARAKACEKLGLDAAGEARFDEAVSAMNERLRASMQTIADLLADQEEMTPELGCRLMGDISTTLAESYDAVGAATTADRRGDVSKLQLVDFIDPMVAEPLIAVQGKLDGPLAGPGRGRK